MILFWFEVDLYVVVIYVVDLRRASYYQKCHDPDCRGMSHCISKLCALEVIEINVWKI